MTGPLLFAVTCAILTIANAIKLDTSRGENWAVLIAGSNGWGNYRHQADICHAFHILHDIGKIPASNIVVMMADDIAYNEENPFWGNIINYPYGPNVYPGVNKNYTGEDVTAKGFLQVLEELPSGSNDNVFVYFSDHGAKGLIAMPFGEPLYADDFLVTLKRMHKKKQFHQMVIYIEACESGSMFDGQLDDEMNIYATTAADDDHSSYAWFFDEKRGVYLADQYSIMWMQDSQQNMTHFETLRTQYNLVKIETNESSVEMFGDLSIQEELVMNFQASGVFWAEVPSSESSTRRKYTDVHSPWSGSLEDAQGYDYVPVDSRDVVLRTLEMRFEVAKREGRSEAQEILQKHIAEEKAYREHVDYVFQRIVAQTVSSVNNFPEPPKLLSDWFAMQTPVLDYDCLRASFNAYNEYCYRGFEDYSYKYVRILSNMCSYFNHDEPTKERLAYITEDVCRTSRK